MTLQPPFPRSKSIRLKRFVPQMGDRMYLPPPSNPTSRNFFEVVASRRSSRELALLDKEHLGALLWYSFRISAMSAPKAEYPFRQSPTPSAGGLQSQNILVQTSQTGLLFYDPVSHSLSAIADSVSISTALFESAMRVIPAPQATALWFAGDEALLSSKYENAESLLWRDSGCLAATLSVVAEALDINACILGITGEPYLSDFFNGNLSGFGGIVLGGRK